jgi:transcriptional antiterminator Rof (Rho-off)
MHEYEPVACGLHEQYEYAVMKKRWLDISWVDEAGKQYRAKALPKDVFTRHKAEYLQVVFNDQETLDIRLDRIQDAYWADVGLPLYEARN